MRSLTVFNYLLWDDGAYQTTSEGDRIIIGSALELEYDESYSRIAGAVSKVCHIRSFNIDWSEETGRWRLMLNKTQLIGFYSTQQQALGVLAGLYRRRGANTDDKLAEVISYELSQGASTIAASTSAVFPVSTAYFSFGKAPVAGLDEFYYSKAADVANGETPDLGMDGVINLMNGGNASLTMIYPDSGASGTISTSADKIWTNFNMRDILDSNGNITDFGYDPRDNSTWVSPTQKFPQLDPAEYVAAVQFYLDSGKLADAAGTAFCFDWESQWLTTQRLGSIFWNDTANPKFREALIELRSQQKSVYDALKVAFPDSYFGMYGGTADIGQSDLKWDGSAFVEGSTNIRWFALCDATQEAVLTQNFKDALAGTEQPWDYVTRVCYDAFAPDSIQQFIDNPASDGTALKPPYRKALYDWSFGLMKSELSVDCLAIISPSNIAQNSFGTTFNDLNPYEWATPVTWVAQTIDFISEADGYLIWDSLRVDQTRQFMVNYTNWADIVARDVANNNTKLQDQLNKWYNLLLDLEEKYGTLTTIANELGIAFPATAENWFDLDRPTQRGVDFVRNAIGKDIVADLESTLIPLIEEWRVGRYVPFVERNAPVITGTADVAQIVGVVTDFVGDADVTYKWMYASSSTELGSGPSYIILDSDRGETIRCRVRFSRDGVQIAPQVFVEMTDAVPESLPGGTATPGGTVAVTAPGAFGNLTLSQEAWELMSTDTYNASNNNTVSPFANGVTLNFATNGATLALPVTTSSVFTFAITNNNGTSTFVLSPASVSAGSLITINDAAFTSALLVGSTVTVDSMTIVV